MKRNGIPLDTLIELDGIDILLALGMVAIAIGISLWQGLGLAGQLALAAGRTILQLLVVGVLLETIFAWETPWLVLAAIALMLTIASIVARNRIDKRLPKLLPLIWGSLWLSTALTLIYTTVLVIRPPIWYDPQYLIPLAGIVMGNSMNAAAIAGERLASTIRNCQLDIETHLSLGASPQQAVAQYRKQAIRAGLIPTLNAMMVVGIVTLPGIVTGQLLSGISPLNAVAYQILIMFMLAFTTLIAASLVTHAICKQFFNAAAQLILP